MLSGRCKWRDLLRASSKLGRPEGWESRGSPEATTRPRSPEAWRSPGGGAPGGLQTPNDSTRSQRWSGSRYVAPPLTAQPNGGRSEGGGRGLGSGGGGGARARHPEVCGGGGGECVAGGPGLRTPLPAGPARDRGRGAPGAPVGRRGAGPHLPALPVSPSRGVEWKFNAGS